MKLKTLALSVQLIRLERHKDGYAPKPPSPPLATWKPVLSQQEQEERSKLIESGALPF